MTGAARQGGTQLVEEGFCTFPRTPWTRSGSEAAAAKLNIQKNVHYYWLRRRLWWRGVAWRGGGGGGGGSV